MAEPHRELLFQVLQVCGQLAPTPFYPSTYTPGHGISRETLDQALDHLRLRGLLRLTDWVQGRGQGYTITAEGQAALHDERLLDRPAAPPPPVAADAGAREFTNPWSRGEAVREALLNPAKPRVTLVLLAVNLFIFVAGLFLGSQQNVDIGDYLAGRGEPLAKLHYNLGSLTPRAILAENEWWRLITHAFLHRGLLHVLLNMYMLYSFGPLVETLWGSWRFLYLYFIAAIWGGCFALVFLSGGVGASGALCGLFASFGVWTVLNRAYLPPDLVSSWLRNLLMNVVLLVLISSLPGISWQAHLGGAIGGVLVAVPLNNQRFGNALQKLAGWVGMLVVPFAGFALVLLQTSDVRALAGLRAEFHDAEHLAVSTYNDHAVKIINDWPDLDQASLPQAKAEFSQARRTLENTQKKLDAFAATDAQGVSQDVRQASLYLGAWGHFYEALLEATSQPPPLPPEPRLALMQMLRNIEPVRAPLVHSQVMQSLLVRPLTN